MAVRAGERGLDLACLIEPGTPAAVLGDVTRLRQTLLNLLSNGVKFTERGEVSLECHVHGEFLETCVRDTGIGIRPEDMNKLFKPFQQLETGLGRRHEGTGLGLSICAHIVTQHGGQLDVESVPGQGSTFRVALPFQPAR